MPAHSNPDLWTDCKQNETHISSCTSKRVGCAGSRRKPQSTSPQQSFTLAHTSLTLAWRHPGNSCGMQRHIRGRLGTLCEIKAAAWARAGRDSVKLTEVTAWRNQGLQLLLCSLFYLVTLSYTTVDSALVGTVSSSTDKRKQLMFSWRCIECVSYSQNYHIEEDSWIGQSWVCPWKTTAGTIPLLMIDKYLGISMHQISKWSRAKIQGLQAQACNTLDPIWEPSFTL